MNTPQKIYSLLTPAERRSGLILLAQMIVGMTLEMVGIGLVIPLIALLTQNDLATRYPALQPALELIGNPTQVQLVTYGTLCFVAVYVVKTLFLTFLAWRQASFAFGVQRHLAQRLFTAYLRQPYAFHLRRNSAQLIHNVAREVGSFTSFALFPGMIFTTEGLVLVGIGALLLMIEPIGSSIVVVMVGAAAWGFHRTVRNRVVHWGEVRQWHDRLALQHLQQGLGSAKDVKLLGREDDFIAQYCTHNARVARVGQFEMTLQQVPRLGMDLVAVVGLTVVVQVLLARSTDMLSIVTMLGLFAMAAFRLLPSVHRVVASAQSLRYGLPVVTTLYEELKLEVPDSPAKRGDSPRIDEEISLTDVRYTYPAAPAPALNGVTMTITKGATLGLIGPSGSGKSTLVDVVLGLLSPEVGAVRVDGRDIHENVRAWQDQIGYVPQVIYLTDDTLRRNVAFGVPDERIDEKAVRRALRDAQLQDFVASLPEGVETVVGERGVRLSGGQRQRIGIARALYHDPAVLVLDEATSALDNATESGVMQAITALHRSKTILIIAHRLTTLKGCDLIYQLDKGRVVSCGNYKELTATTTAAAEEEHASGMTRMFRAE